MGNLNHFLQSTVGEILGRRILLAPADEFGRLAREASEPISKLFYWSLCAAIPLALLGNALCGTFGVNGYAGKFLAVSAVLLIPQAVLAVFLLKRSELAKQRLNLRWLLMFLLWGMAAAFLTGIFLWMLAELAVNAEEMKRFTEIVNHENFRTVKSPGWGVILWSFLYLIGIFVLPLFISFFWNALIVQTATLFGAPPPQINSNWLDDVAGHWDDMAEIYQCPHDHLTEADQEYIFSAAVASLAFFMKWIVINHLEGEIHQNTPECAALRHGTMEAAEFIMFCCDSTLTLESVNPEAHEFVRGYYPHYQNEYFCWFGRHVDPRTGLYVPSPGDYEKFAPIIDRNYRAWMISQGAFADFEIPVELRSSANPFSVWLERKIPGAALQTEAYNIFAEAYAEILELSALPESERVSAFCRVLLDFVEGFNILDRYEPWIETMEREEIYEAALQLRKLAREQVGIVMDDDGFSALFDENREW